MKIVIGIVIGCAALFLGATSGLALGGFGICAVTLSWGNFFFALVAAIIISLVGASTLPSARWLAPSLYSAAMLPGLAWPIYSHEWLRCLALLGCVAGAFVAVSMSHRIVELTAKL